MVNDDLYAWTSALHGASAAAGRRWTLPPGIVDLPPVVVPAWTKLRAYIGTGVILDDPPPQKRIPAASVGRPSGKRGRKEHNTCFQWGKKKTCRFGDACMYAHDPGTKRVEAGGVAVGEASA